MSVKRCFFLQFFYDESAFTTSGRLVNTIFIISKMRNVTQIHHLFLRCLKKFGTLYTNNSLQHMKYLVLFNLQQQFRKQSIRIRTLATPKIENATIITNQPKITWKKHVMEMTTKHTPFILHSMRKGEFRGKEKTNRSNV